jgi:hypothetical protein
VFQYALFAVSKRSVRALPLPESGKRGRFASTASPATNSERKKVHAISETGLPCEALGMLARIAEGSLGLTGPVDDRFVAPPLGLVETFWLRQFKLVLQEGLQQMPNKRRARGTWIRQGCLSTDKADFASRFPGRRTLHRTRRTACSSGHPGCSRKHQADARDLHVVPEWAPRLSNHFRSKAIKSAAAANLKPWREGVTSPAAVTSRPSSPQTFGRWRRGGAASNGCPCCGGRSEVTIGGCGDG